MLAVPASAGDLRVGSGFYSTIQAAVDAAQPGDRILVGSGNWAGAHVEKAVEIRGNGDARIVAGPLYLPLGNPDGRTLGFLIGAEVDGAGGDGVTIAQLTFTEAVDLPVFSRGANNVTVSQNLILNPVQGVTNRGGKRWNITHNTFRDLRSDNGGAIAIMVGDNRFRDVQDNLVAYNHISGTLHVAADELGGYDGTAIALFADFRSDYGYNGAKSIAFNRVLKNSVSLVSDNPGLVDIVAFEMTIGVNTPAEGDPDYPSELTDVIHNNVIGFNDFKGTARQMESTPTVLDAQNSISLGDNVFTGGSDFDGDGKADMTAFRPSSRSTWLVKNSGDQTGTSVQWGIAGDVPVAGDYDGDDKVDFAMFRPSSGAWYIANSSTQTVTGVYWGTAGDVPVPGDYDGDNKTDVAVFRPSNGTWYVRGVGVAYLGVATDRPVPADYDGDGKTDIAVFRPSNGTWWVKQSSNGEVKLTWWGNSADTLLPADYDGDGKADVAVFTPSTGTWWVKSSRTGAATWANWGAAGDTPVPADYDGDKVTDVAIYRPSEGKWYIFQSSTKTLAEVWWGTSSDIAVP